MFILCMTIPAVSSGEAAGLDNFISEIAQGSREALAGLYGKTHAAVYGFALSILKNAQDAEDVLQDCYLQIWQGASGYRSQGKPMAWIFTITRRLSLMKLRDRDRTIPMTPEDWQTQFADQPDLTREDRLTLEALLTVLSDEERQIVVLHAFTGLKHRETAALLELPLPTVLSKYNRALKKLRAAMKEES